MMGEEVTTSNIQKLISKMPANTSPLEKVILCNDGTVQTLLSVIFGVPVRVEVLSQSESDSYIVRWSRLVAEYSPDNIIVVCLAESIISKKTKYKGFITGITEKHMGIGQLISSVKIDTQRSIVGIYADDNVFARTYTILSIENEDDYCLNDQLSVTITETFLKSVYDKLK